MRDSVLAEIRGVLQATPSLQRWKQLLSVLGQLAQAPLDDQSDDQAVRDHAVEQARELLAAWPDRMRPLPHAWVDELLRTGSHPLLSLAGSVFVRRQARGLSVCLNWNEFPDVQAEDPAALERFPWMRDLGVIDMAYWDRAPVAKLCKSGPLPGLHTLVLAGARLDSAAMGALATDLDAANLHTLVLSKCRLTDDALEQFAPAGNRAALRHLDLSLNKLGAGAARALVGNLPAALEVLDLTGNALGDEGAAVLAGAERLAGLRVLRLGGNGFSEKGVAALSGSPHLGKLVELDLDLNGMGPQGQVPHVGRWRLVRAEEEHGEWLGGRGDDTLMEYYPQQDELEHAGGRDTLTDMRGRDTVMDMRGRDTLTDMRGRDTVTDMRAFMGEDALAAVDPAAPVSELLGDRTVDEEAPFAGEGTLDEDSDFTGEDTLDEEMPAEVMTGGDTTAHDLSALDRGTLDDAYRDGPDYEIEVRDHLRVFVPASEYKAGAATADDTSVHPLPENVFLELRPDSTFRVIDGSRERERNLAFFDEEAVMKPTGAGRGHMYGYWIEAENPPPHLDLVRDPFVRSASCWEDLWSDTVIDDCVSMDDQGRLVRTIRSVSGGCHVSISIWTFERAGAADESKT